MIELLKNWKNAPVSKIVGGEVAAEGRHGYAAALFNEEDNFLCSGVLITPSLVLTSATCPVFAGEDPSTVVLGCSNIVSREGCEVIATNQTFTSPLFNNSFVFGNDFAIVQLTESSAQLPIAIGLDENVLIGLGENFGNYPATVMGWGIQDPNAEAYDNYGSSRLIGSEELLVTEVFTSTNEECSNKYTDLLTVIYQDQEPYYDIIDSLIDNTMICASGSGKGPCDGDEGGALVLDCGSDDQDALFGIYGFQLGCGYEGIPGIYARTSSLEFIQFLFDVLTVVDDNRIRFLFDNSDFCIGQDQNPTPFPTFAIDGWLCPGVQYATGDGCNCDCGIPDPDCEFESAEVFNCAQGEQCIQGVCSAPLTQSPTFEGETFPPSVNPSIGPTRSPVSDQTQSPTVNPSIVPTDGPTIQPTGRPTNTDAPTEADTNQPTASPVNNNDDNDNAADDQEAIVGALLILIGLLVVVLACMCCLVCLQLKRRKTPLSSSTQASPMGKPITLI